MMDKETVEVFASMVDTLVKCVEKLSGSLDKLEASVARFEVMFAEEIKRSEANSVE